MPYASLGPIAVHFPDRVETNDELRERFPKWDLDLIYSKTGVRQRHIAGPDECASDLAVAAAEKLFAQHAIAKDSIDFILLCTQTPDYPLPTTACLLQDRLGLPTSVGALDFNLGCSGFVYGLSLADGLIRSGAARRILLITAETYSKYIEPDDRSLRTIFGDAAAVTLIDSAETPSLDGFVFGTDGDAADALLVATGGARTGSGALAPRKRPRWGSRLVMDGPALVEVTLSRIPKLVDEVLQRAHWDRDRTDYYLLHQASAHMLNRLRERLKITEEQAPTFLEHYGNTVSSTIPIVIQEMRSDGRMQAGKHSLLVGFGVGFSWAGCLWRETQM